MSALKDLLDRRFGGVLRPGTHPNHEMCCALELLAVYKEMSWTDRPHTVGCYDLRNLNDSPYWVDDEQRTHCMLPILEELKDSMEWCQTKQKEFCFRLFENIVQHVDCFSQSSLYTMVNLLYKDRYAGFFGILHYLVLNTQQLMLLCSLIQRHATAVNKS